MKAKASNIVFIKMLCIIVIALAVLATVIFVSYQVLSFHYYYPSLFFILILAILFHLFKKTLALKEECRRLRYLEHRKLKATFNCPHCKKTISYECYHAGYSDVLCYYCDSCSCVAIVDIYNHELYKLRKKEDCNWDVVPSMLKPCVCGGHFSKNAIPRCPFCNIPIKYEDVVKELATVAYNPKYFIEQSGKDGWHGIYYHILEGKKQENPLK